MNPNFTVDGVIARLESVVVGEYEKGGTAASIKAAVDKAIDQIQKLILLREAYGATGKLTS